MGRTVYEAKRRGEIARMLCAQLHGDTLAVVGTYEARPAPTYFRGACFLELRTW